MEAVRGICRLSLALLSFVSTVHAAGFGPVVSAADKALGPDAAANRALQEGRADDAAAMLTATLTAHPEDAIAHQLLCRVFYSQDKADEAIHECETAVLNEQSSSDNQLWLGRAYGLKARHAGPLGGFTLARKVHDCFERAVGLNPNSVAAMNDLGEYYISAPSIVGGGNDKAQALAGRMMPRFPGAAHRMLALIAEDDKDYATSEAEFKATIGIAQKSGDTHAAAQAWVDLAHFYRKRSRPDDALSAVNAAIAADRAGNRPADAVLVDAASVLSAAHRAPETAEQCLRLYLASPAKTDEAPAFKVHLQLSKLLAARGDSQAAKMEVAAAVALASRFARQSSSAQEL